MRAPGREEDRMIQLPPIVVSAGLLVASNVFMTFAWYAHLKNLSSKPWWIAALASWGIALFEYLLQVPANRIGFTQVSLAQLKIMQEAITLIVFVPYLELRQRNLRIADAVRRHLQQVAPSGRNTASRSS